MKFHKTDLIARIDALLTTREAEKELARQKAELDSATAADLWLHEHSEAFGQFAERIKFHLKRKQPITADMRPEGIKGRYNDGVAWFFPPSTRTPEDRQAESLKKLRNALLASTEDTVSPTAIKQLGFQDVTFLFTAEAGK